MNVDLLQKAVKIIETEGSDGLCATEKLIGMPIALALFIAHLRRAKGSMNGWPPDPNIDNKVKTELEAHIPAVANFFGQNECALFYVGQWYCFDNFSAFAINWRDRNWSTVEHAYQASKFNNPEVVEQIWRATSAHEAKKIANDPQNNHLIRSDWENVKHVIMKEILLAKLDQHPYVQKKLRESRGMMLVEDSHQDAHWGRGRNWDGKNWLGRIWMEIREELYPD